MMCTRWEGGGAIIIKHGRLRNAPMWSKRGPMCFKMVPMNVSFPKTWGWTPKSSLKHVQNPSYILDHFTNLDHFVHSVQSELSEKGLNKTPGIRHQNQVYIILWPFKMR